MASLFRPITRPLFRPLFATPDTYIKGGGVANPIVELLAKGTSGFWHGGDASRFFTDTAGTDPAVDAGDLVGLSQGRGEYADTLQQSSIGLKPSLRFDGAKSVLRYDGTDDYSLSEKTAGASGTWFLKFKAAVGNNAVALAGLRTSAGNGQLFVNLGLGASLGQVSFAVGSATADSGRGGPNLQGVVAVAAVAYDGSNRRVYVDTGSGSAMSHTGVAGSPNTGVPFAFGGLNTNGTLGLYEDYDLYQTVYVKGYAATADEIAAVAARMMQT